MILSLAGYMGSGKSHVSKILCKKTKFDLTDLDLEISKTSGQSISELFEKKGEIYFRKLEREVLESLLKDSSTSRILSLGGGTPAYYNNMELINQYSTSIFLRASVSTLTERLSRNREKRPLIAKLNEQDLQEFIAKHLFERNAFYTQCHHTIVCDNKSAENVVEEILSLLNLP